MTTKQTEAQRLAEYWEARANGLQTWVDENDYVEFGYRPEGLKREQSDQRRTATELRRLDEANKELLEALKNVTVHLIAAHSLLSRGGKKAAASDKIFGIMLEDYEKSFEVGRAAIAKHKGETK